MTSSSSPACGGVSRPSVQIEAELLTLTADLTAKAGQMLLVYNGSVLGLYQPLPQQQQGQQQAAKPQQQAKMELLHPVVLAPASPAAAVTMESVHAVLARATAPLSACLVGDALGYARAAAAGRNPIGRLLQKGTKLGIFVDVKAGVVTPSGRHIGYYALAAQQPQQR